MSEKLKMYFVCRYDGPQWWYCMGLLSNGFHFADHVCSSPSFAPGDLYFTRQNRITALRKVFDIDPQTIETEVFLIKVKADVPEWWERLANTQSVQDELKDKYAEYKELAKEE